MNAKVKKHLILAAVLLVLCFIWGNSLLPGTESGKISGGLLAWLKETVPFLKGLTGHLIRKLGHFSEFTALGFFLSWLLRMENQQGIHRVRDHAHQQATQHLNDAGWWGNVSRSAGQMQR